VHVDKLEMAYLIDILVFERPWPTKCDRKVFVERVRTPEKPPATLQLNIVNSSRRVALPSAMQAYRKSKMRQRPEEVPAVVDTRLCKEVEALQ
jgi:hypothetical protein